jgi:hypothetical protein
MLACATIAQLTSWTIDPWVPGWRIGLPGDEVVKGEKTSTSEYHEKCLMDSKIAEELGCTQGEK